MIVGWEMIISQPQIIHTDDYWLGNIHFLSGGADGGDGDGGGGDGDGEGGGAAMATAATATTKAAAKATGMMQPRRAKLHIAPACPFFSNS